MEGFSLVSLCFCGGEDFQVIGLCERACPPQRQPLREDGSQEGIAAWAVERYAPLSLRFYGAFGQPRYHELLLEYAEQKDDGDLGQDRSGEDPFPAGGVGAF